MSPGCRPISSRAGGIARFFQISSVFPRLTILDNVRLALQARTSFGYAFWLPGKTLTRFDREAESILLAVGLAGMADRHAGELPYGQKRALENLGV